MRRTAAGLAALVGLVSFARAQDCTPPLDGLVVWWDADDVKWDPGHNQGPYATDITDRIAGPPLALVALGQNPDPTLWLPQFAPGMVGQAFSFDPTHPQFSSLRMTTQSEYAGDELDFTNALSIELWMKWSPALPYYSPFFGLVNATGDGYYLNDQGFGLFGTWGDGRLLFRIGSGAGQAQSLAGNANVLDGSWHHVVATFDASLPSGNQKLYVDGALDASADWSLPILPVGSVVLASGPEYGGMRGLLDEVLFYDRALTPAEVDGAYHGPGRCRPDFPARPNPSGWLADFAAQPTNDRVAADLDLDGDVLAVAEPANGTYELTGAHVFRRSGADWVHEQRITPTFEPGWNNGAGLSVAVSGDVLVQGVWTGVAVHRFDGATWQQEFIDQSWPNGPTRRGYAVDVSGDTLVVGAPGTGSSPACNVEVFRHVGGEWQAEPEAVIAGPAGSYFGAAVALEGDLLAVGAWNASLGTSGGGALYLYRRTGTTWTQAAVVTPQMVAPDRPSHDGFALGGQVHLDGERLLVGAVGTGFVLDVSGGGLVVEGELLTSLPAGGIGQDVGGGTVWLAGDLAAMGAPTGGEFSSYLTYNATGSVLVFARQAGTWTEIGRCRAGSGNLALGSSVVIDGGQVLASAPGARYIWFPSQTGRHLWTFQGFEAALNPSRPIADAGDDQVVDEGAAVTLDGSGSFDGDGDPLGHAWSQVGGPAVTLSDAAAAAPTFTAPWVAPGGETLTFQLVVDDGDLVSDPDVVNVTVTNVNGVPVAQAGADQTVAEGSPVTLDGRDSYDVDEEALSFAWTQLSGPAVALAGAAQAQAGFTAPAVGPGGAQLVFELRVSDGVDTSAPDSVTVEVTNVNNAPVADAGLPQTVDELTLVFLDGSASADPDGDPLSYAWTQVSGPAVSLSSAASATPSFTAPDVSGVVELGFALTVADGQGGLSEPAYTTVAVRDGNAAPECGSARADVGMLWPPNHKLVPVRVVGVSDLDDDSIQITILGVWQDEPTNGLGDGDTGPADAVIQGDTVLLRAERSGLGDGRVYHVSFLAQDASGASCQGTVQVVVPHAKKQPVGDGGPLFPSIP